MTKKIIKTDLAPQAIGPYSQAVKAGDFLYLSGQIGLGASGNLVEGGVEEQTKQILDNIKAVLGAGKASLKQVVKTTVFLKNMEDFGKVNAIYGQYFSENPPARATVEVSRLPRDVLVEIDGIAFLG